MIDCFCIRSMTSYFASDFCDYCFAVDIVAVDGYCCYCYCYTTIVVAVDGAGADDAVAIVFARCPLEHCCPGLASVAGSMWTTIGCWSSAAVLDW